MVMSELGPIDSADSSTNSSCVCPASWVAIRSLNTTSWPITRGRLAPPGGVPTACGLTALLTPTLSWAIPGLAVPSSKTAALAAARANEKGLGIGRLLERGLLPGGHGNPEQAEWTAQTIGIPAPASG